jgi:lactate racemase
MATFKLTYNDETHKITIPDTVKTDLAVPKDLPVIEDKYKAIRESINHPVGKQSLRGLIRPGRKIAIVVTDITRKLPEKEILECLLDEILGCGGRLDDISIIIATGAHRPNTSEEIISMLGTRVYESVKVINHTAFDRSTLKRIGTFATGHPIEINRIVAEADIRISTGVIEPHKLAGYSGGVKSLAIGVAGADTIGITHRREIVEHPKTRLGVTRGNIFRDYLNEIASYIGLDFIVNVVQNGAGELLGVFSGEPIQTHQLGVDMSRQYCETTLENQYDLIVAVPGYPKENNLYQATRAINNIIFGPHKVVRKDGTIIIPACCEDGAGDRDLQELLASSATLDEVIEKINRKEDQVGGALVAYKLATVMKYCHLVMSDCQISSEQLGRMFMSGYPTLQQAIDTAIAREGIESILILPHAILTLPVIEQT